MSLPEILREDDLMRDLVVIRARWRVGNLRGDANLAIAHEWLARLAPGVGEAFLRRTVAPACVAEAERQVFARMIGPGS